MRFGGATDRIAAVLRMAVRTDTDQIVMACDGLLAHAMIRAFFSPVQVWQVACSLLTSAIKCLVTAFAVFGRSRATAEHGLWTTGLKRPSR